jgi:putative alpha-1,2-mannosidase
MSAWAVFSMMGIYPDCPGEPYYTITTPRFERVEMDTLGGVVVIECQGEGEYIDSMQLGDKPLAKYRISHDELMRGGKLTLKLY